MATKDLTAYQEHHDAIRAEFKKQAANWARDEISPQLLWVVEHLRLQLDFAVLDVAAGSGLLSRAIAPYVKSVVALDITPEMLAQGRNEAGREGLTNIGFEQGTAEALPYAGNSFDMVVTRFSVHHFKSPDVVLGEMLRVCRVGGSLVVIDIVAPEDEGLAARYNQVERLRDSTHTQALSPGGLKKLIEETGVEIVNYYSLEVENSLDDWLDFTDTDVNRRWQITNLLQRELVGLGETGMRPFLSGDKIMFRHTWGIVVGEKRQGGDDSRIYRI